MLLWQFPFLLALAVVGISASLSVASSTDSGNLILIPFADVQREIFTNEEVKIYESTKRSLLRYSSLNFFNTRERTEMNKEYSLASNLLNALVKKQIRTVSLHKKEVSTYTEAIEHIVSLYASDSLDGFVAELFAYSTNYRVIWDSFSDEFKKKYIKGSIVGLVRAGDHRDIEQMLKSTLCHFEEELSDFYQSLILPAYQSGSPFTRAFVKNLAMQHLKQDDVIDQSIESSILLDSPDLLTEVMNSVANVKKLDGYLFKAIRVGSLKVVDCLLSSIFSIEKRPYFPKNILSETVYNSNFEMLESLLEYKRTKEGGKNLFKTKFYLQPVFEKACEMGNINFIDYLISNYNQIDPVCIEASFIAASNGQLEVIKYLLDVFEKNPLSPYIFACRIASIRGVAIMNKHYEINEYLQSVDKFKMLSFPQFLMFHAFEKGDLDIINYCLITFENGIRKFEREGAKYLSIGIGSGHEKIVRNTLKRFPNLKVGLANNLLLQTAIDYGSVKTARMLLQRKNNEYIWEGVDPAFNNNEGIRTAVETSDVAMIKVLLEHFNGERVHSQVSIMEQCQRSKLSALDIAMKIGNNEILDILLEKNCEEYIHFPRRYKINHDFSVIWKSLSNALIDARKFMENNPEWFFIPLLIACACMIYNSS